MARRFTAQAFREMATNKALRATKQSLKLLLSNLAETTPVDEGVLVNNWVVSTGSASTSFIDAAGTGASMYSREAPKLDNLRFTTGTVFITNNAPYAGYVESGTEHQPAQHYTRRAINRTRRSI